MRSGGRLRVLFLAHAYPRHAGDPVGSFVANLAVALREAGVDTIVSAPSGPGLAAHEMIDGIPVHRFRYAPRDHETLAYTGTMGAQVKEGLAGKAAMASYLAGAALAARGLLRRERIDVLHAHWWFPAGLVASAVTRGSRTPFVATLHGSDLRLARAFPFGDRLLAHVLRRAAAVTAVSTWLARGAEARVHGVAAEVAPMPVLDELFAPGPPAERDDARLLFVGKLTEQKGLHRLLRAMAGMRHRARLTVVGAGRVDDAAVRALADELGLASRVTWLPLLGQRELAAEYRRAAVHVVPALDEGLGLTAVESLLSGTPVVGFASGGLPDIVRDGRGGRLVPPGDVEALGAALDALLDDPALRDTLGRDGRADALAAFGRARAAGRYAELYARVHANHATG